MFVGGEFYPDPRWVRAEPQLNTTGLTFLNGGRACLTVIAADLRSHGVRQWLDTLPAGALQGIKTAAFDTRMSVKDAKVWILTILVKIFGYAAEPMAKKLQAKGGQPTGTPAGFLVKGTEGPLFDGELERAAAWAQGLTAN